MYTFYTHIFKYCFKNDKTSIGGGGKGKGMKQDAGISLLGRDLFKAALKATLSIPGPLSAPFPAVHHMALTPGFLLRPFRTYFH